MKFAFVIAALFAASAIAAPCGRKHVDDVADVPDVPQVDDVPSVPATVDSDAEDERKTSVSDNKQEDSQTAVINNNSGEKKGGSLFNVDASNLLAGGVLSHTENTVKQKSN